MNTLKLGPIEVVSNETRDRLIAKIGDLVAFERGRVRFVDPMAVNTSEAVRVADEYRLHPDAFSAREQIEIEGAVYNA